MKIRGILILSLFIFNIVSFSSIHIKIDPSHSEQPIMVTLDVCHMADAYSKGGSDIPSITTPLTMLPLPLLSGDLEQRPFVSLVPFKLQPEERPPRILT